MFLSFIVPVYNVEQYVGECLDSLLDQDIPREDYEIICVNDGSTDESLAVLRQYADRYTNIRVIDKPNGGVASARNAGCDAAQGDYLWFVDSDDFIQKNFLSQLRTEAVSCDVVDFGAYVFREELSQEEREAMWAGTQRPTSYANYVYVTRSIYKYIFLKEHGIRFDEQLAFSEDGIFSCNCLVQNAKRTRIEKTGYYFRQRPGSATAIHTTLVQEKKLNSWCIAACCLKDMYEMCDGSHKAIVADLLMANLWYALHGITMAKPEHGRKTIRELRKHGLFPFVRPKECTLRKSFNTTRTDFLGKLYDRMYINLHRPWGFAAMILYHAVWDLMHKKTK